MFQKFARFGLTVLFTNSRRSLIDPADPKGKGSMKLRNVKIYPKAQRNFPEEVNPLVLNLIVVLLRLSKQIPG
jgi:hypothetical protein